MKIAKTIIILCYHSSGSGGLPLHTAWKKIFACTFPFVLILAALASLNVSADPATTVYINPKDFVDLTLTAGRSFYINISVSDASDVWGYQAALAYNKSILTATNFSSFDPFTTAYPNVIDDSGVEKLRPTLNGRFSNWTGTYAAWADVTADGDTTYVYAGNTGLTQTSALTNSRVKAAWDKIQKIIVVFVAQQTSGDENLVPVLWTGNRLFNGSAVTPSTVAYTEYTYTWDKSPVSNSAWSWAELDALEAGLRTEQNGATFDGQVRVTQLFVEVYHEAGFLSVSYSKPFGVNTGETGSFPLVRVGFNVDAEGTSILDLHNTKLSTPAGGEITHDEVDGSFTNVNIHDLVVTSVTPSKNRIATAGESLTLDVTVANPGDFNETFYVTLTYDGNLIDNQTGIFLDIDQNTTLTFTWDTTGLADAEYTVRAQAILSVLDNYPDNNILDAKVRIGVIRDVAVITVTPLPTEVYVGESVLITVLLRNQGNFSEAISVTIKYGSTVIGTEAVTPSPLAAGQSAQVDFTWETGGLTEGNYIVQAEATIAVDDDTTNNFGESILIKVGAGGIPITWVYAGIALIAIIILLIVVYIVLRIRKRKSAKPT
jgi:hypothetical protein